MTKDRFKSRALLILLRKQLDVAVLKMIMLVRKVIVELMDPRPLLFAVLITDIPQNRVKPQTTGKI